MDKKMKLSLAYVIVFLFLWTASSDGIPMAQQDSIGKKEQKPKMILEMVVFDFEKAPAQTAWQNIDDVVMGGVSSSRMRISQGIGVFEGILSLENNGGFASIRSQPADHNLSGFDGVAIKAKGDGKNYSFRIRTNRGFDSVGYTAPLVLPKVWSVIKVPFCAFKATYHGRILPDYPILDPASVKMFGLLISQKQEGSFRLDIKSISAYKEPYFASFGDLKDLSLYKGAKRLLVVFATSPEDSMLKNQRKYIVNGFKGFAERDMVVIEIASASSKVLRKKFNAPQAVFSVILVGKDGGRKSLWKKPVEMNKVFALIDAMPMRQREIKQKQK